MGNFYYVYVLVDTTNPARHCTGITEHLENRLAEHNSGQCEHTSKFGPWRIETAVAFHSHEKAAAFERYLKSHPGRAFAAKHF